MDTTYDTRLDNCEACGDEYPIQDIKPMQLADRSWLLCPPCRDGEVLLDEVNSIP